MPGCSFAFADATETLVDSGVLSTRIGGGVDGGDGDGDGTNGVDDRKGRSAPIVALIMPSRVPNAAVAGVRMTKKKT